MRLRHVGTGRHGQIHAYRHALRQLLQRQILHYRAVVGGDHPDTRRHVFVTAGLWISYNRGFGMGILLLQPFGN
ncbi:hypothetical protein D3C81_1960830 [compost metagenome]